MRRRNLMRSRVYRRDPNTFKRIPSTFNQKETKTATQLKNTDMSFESNKTVPKSIIPKKKMLYFSLDVECCNIFSVLNDIPLDTDIGSYGRLTDVFINKIYFKNSSGTIKDELCGLTDIEALTYSKWVVLYFVVLSNNTGAADVTVNTHNLTYVEDKNKSRCCKNSTRAKFRLPIKGYRKELVKCADNYDDGKNIYMDNYAKSSIGSGCKYDASGNVVGTVFSRTNYPVIRSGMLDNGKTYRSYRDYLRNGALSSYDRSLEKNRNDKDDCSKCLKNVYYKSTSNKGRTLRNSQIRTIYKPNNKKFKVQGAVSSSSRLDRLKLDTITTADANKVRKCS